MVLCAFSRTCARSIQCRMSTVPQLSLKVRWQSSSAAEETSVTPFNARFEDESTDMVTSMDHDLEPEVYIAWDGEEWDHERIARNVSRLRPHVRNRMYHVNKMPVKLFDYQETKLNLRKTYARFGRASGISPGIMWPSREEIEQLQKYETEVLQMPTLQESWKRVRDKKKLQQDDMRKHDEEISRNMAKMDAEIKAFRTRQRKAEETILIEKQKREKLMEEAKEVLGYHVDPRDKRFQELLDAKEKEQSKLQKQQKKKEKEAKAIARLTAEDAPS